MTTLMHHFTPLLPYDEFNRELEANVHPRDWINPKPSGRYNLVVVGAGTAGLVTAAGAAGLGAKVALVERELLGGDCLNVGCVPSKALLSAARRVAAVQRADEFGVRVNGAREVDFGAVMQRMRRLRAGISPHDSAARFRDLGIDVFLGGGRFTGHDRIEVGGETLEFKRAVIATGARAAAPPNPGLDAVDYLTNESVFSLTELPKRLAVIGAGPIGCEMAQAFARFGSKVFLVEALHGILPKEDSDAARIVLDALERDGVLLLCCGKDLIFSKTATGSVRLQVHSHGKAYDQTVDNVLIGAGRAPNVEGLGLENAGVAYTKNGVTVNDHLQTSNPRIFAAGDICSQYQFTHAADFMARTVIQNALFMGRARVSSLIIPWCTYTEPEVAHVGIYEKEAQENGMHIESYNQPLRAVDRAILDGQTDGFARVHVKKGTDEILGATIVAPHAGDMISHFTMAMTNGLGLKKIARTIFPYPTQAEAVRKTGDAYNRTRLTPFVKKLFNWWLSRTR
jgi:pyruvate/2-oxoglutarate dehydrogenase complex dihydrolipoamide dehydrogenase (E3) component